jgi:hypothetical protein
MLFQLMVRNSKSIAVTVMPMANQSIRDENPALTAVVTGAVNGGDTIN